jgi:hypothetical protein
VDYRVSAEDRAAFKRCRRQWDFGARQRQNLTSIARGPGSVGRAVLDALAVYYYPGMWDWASDIVLPLVRKAYLRTMAAGSAPSADVDHGVAVLERYFAWAPSLDDFCPLKIETDVEALLPDVREPDRALTAPDGERVLYTDRVAMLAVDAADECWVVVHDVVPQWQPVEALLLDEAAVAACWTWEHTFLGIDVAGTVHNEILSVEPDGSEAAPTTTLTGRPGRGGYSQNEPSGGGRLAPQLRRPDRIGRGAAIDERVNRTTAGVVRRTRIRRTRMEIEISRQQVGAEVVQMLDPALAIYPTPSPAHCPGCPFVAPCLTMTEGGDPSSRLEVAFRQRSATEAFAPRLGSGGAGGRYIPIPPQE